MNVHSSDCSVQLASSSHADQRSADILASVRQAFVEKGFDGASMQDLARAAGMSVGNFYRYFPSKAAIVQALIALDMAEMNRDFSAIIGSARPMQALRDMIRPAIARHQRHRDGALWAEIAAAAMRKPEIQTVTCTMESEIVTCLTAVFAAETGIDLVKSQRLFSAQSAFIVMLFKAAATVQPENGPDHADLSALILRSIDQTLDDIASTALKA